MPYYKVVSNHEVLEHQPGEVFEADLSPDQFRSLHGAGHLEAVVKEAPTVAPPVNREDTPKTEEV